MARSARGQGAQAPATDAGQTEREVREMLVLAMLSYRGFQDVTVPLPDVALLRGAIDRGLGSLDLVKGQWEVVWGPVSYRAPFSLFDSTMMYVVRGKEEQQRHRYVVVIRGTNPISAFDWLFGDFWSARQLAWPYGTNVGDAKISFSTALGLSTLQHMHASGPGSGIAADLWRFVDRDIGGRLRAAGEAVLRPIRDAASAVFERMRGRIATLADAVVAEERARAQLTTPDLVARIKQIRDARKSTARRQLLELVDEEADRAGDQHQLDLYDLIEGTSWVRTRLEVGRTLQSLLTAAVAQADHPLEVTVTGHSKGGALASTTALWLADTQGTDGVPEPRQWDPKATATVRCFSYAGPTAGNGAFAEHSDAKIGATCVRTVNTKDVVPHAWTAADLEAIPDLYQPGVHRIEAVGDLIAEIVAEQREQGLDYCHPGTERRIEGRVDLGRPLFFDQFLYQHMEAYLHGLGLTDVNTDTFFGALS